MRETCRQAADQELLWAVWASLPGCEVKEITTPPVCQSSEKSGELQRTECGNVNAEGKKPAAELPWEVTERDEEGEGLLEQMLVQGQV